MQSFANDRFLDRRLALADPEESFVISIVLRQVSEQSGRTGR